MKTEPDVFSIDDLKKRKKEPWDGVRNYQARNFMRDAMQIGDLVLIYHSNANPPGVAGIGKVVSKPYNDPTQFDPKSKYYDAKSKKEDPRWQLVDIGFVEKFSEVIPLPRLREENGLENMLLLKKGMRLSIQPVTKKEYEHILRLA